MTAQKSFHEILHDKMAEENGGDLPSQNSSTESVILREKTPISPLENIIWVNFKVDSPRKMASQAGFYRGKMTKKPASWQTKNEKPKPPEVEIPLEKLSVAGQLALSQLRIYGPNIKLSEVKRAYRRLARKLHPDTNPEGGTQKFIELKVASEIVITELKELITQSATKAKTA